MAHNKKHQNYNLELSLALIPVDTTNHNHLLSTSNQVKQALRRREAKLKRDLKRKLGSNLALTTNNQHSQGHNGHFLVENMCSVSTSTSVDNNYYCNSSPGGSSSDTSSDSSHPSEDVPTTTSTPKQPTSSQQKATPNYSNHNLPHSQLYRSSSSQTIRFPNLRPPSESPELATATKTNITYQSIELPSKKAKAITEKPYISNGKITSHKSMPLPQIPCAIWKSNSNSQQIETQPKTAEEVTTKPSNSNGHITSQESVSLSKMPYVTTTGNGPKGKTITGFLYKYTKIEVSIVCVCHGTSFTPAGFVEHAGGVDVEHPLKHIKVAPYAP